MGGICRPVHIVPHLPPTGKPANCALHKKLEQGILAPRERKRGDLTNSRLVYSTDFGRACPVCEQPIAECVCRKQTTAPSDHVVRVRREVKGRKGKTVTTITGVPLDPEGVDKLASALKRQCGTGGSVKDGVIILQGDHCDALIPLLQKRGYTVKRSGG